MQCPVQQNIISLPSLLIHPPRENHVNPRNRMFCESKKMEHSWAKEMVTLPDEGCLQELATFGQEKTWENMIFVFK